MIERKECNIDKDLKILHQNVNSLIEKPTDGLPTCPILIPN